MSKHNKLEELKTQLRNELGKTIPDGKLITKLKKQIMMLGLGLTGIDIKPF